MKDGKFVYCYKDLQLPKVEGDCYKKGVWYEISIEYDQTICIAFPPLCEQDEDGICTITGAKWKLPIDTINEHFYTKQQLRKAKILQLNK